jgi:hypothetical protein
MQTYGVLGDILLTVFALFWMLWPILASFYLQLAFAFKFIAAIVTV